MADKPAAKRGQVADPWAQAGRTSFPQESNQVQFTPPKRKTMTVQMSGKRKTAVQLPANFN